MRPARDHGGGLDAAIARYGGTRNGWLDLSTGINPLPYPVGNISSDAWTALPDKKAMERLLDAAQTFWDVPKGAQIIAAPGASAIIARMPDLAGTHSAYIPTPTYNEHAAAFHARHPALDISNPQHPAHIYVHPNNPDGRLWAASELSGAFTVIDESFCDVAPEHTHVDRTTQPNTVVLKSFGKFWGLAGLRLGFAIGHPETLSPKLNDLMGPWAVAGPALDVAARALTDTSWANATRTRLSQDTHRLDQLLQAKGAQLQGGTDLFRLYEVDDAAQWQDRLARADIWSRIFPYSKTWLRLGLPHPDRWDQLEVAL